MITIPTIGTMLPPQSRAEFAQRVLAPHKPSLRIQIERMKWRDLLPDWFRGFFVANNKIDGFFWR